jgi:plastocyanin
MAFVQRARWIAASYALLAALAAPAVLFAAEDGDTPEPAAQPQTAPPAEQPPAEGSQPVAPQEPPAEPQQEAAGEPAAEPEPAPVARAAAGSVTIKDFAFGPKSVTVSVGDSVTWSNSGPSAHTATATNGSFDTGLLNRGRSGSHKFTKAGTFAYFCRPHPFMKGTIKVVGASSGGGGGSSGTPSGGGGGSSGGTAGASGQGADSTESSSGSGLPASGLETGVLAALGAALLGLGLALRRRAT